MKCWLTERRKKKVYFQRKIIIIIINISKIKKNIIKEPNY